jgi:hypothetical protein
MDSLNLTPPHSGKTPILPAVSVPKSPGLAFLLSLFVPGLGQFYCGQKRRAMWTFLFFTAGLGLVVWLASSSDDEGTTLLGIGLRTSLVLYVFSFLDAFFTAREMSDGTHVLLQYNPRVAAVLNLLTRGFGYWYLDEKKKGVLLFFCVGAAGRIAMTSHNTAVSGPLSVFVEIALAVMALDAYRMAELKNSKWLEAQPTTHAPMPEPTLKPTIPLALASLLALGYAVLVFIGVAMPEEKSMDQTESAITQIDHDSLYSNKKYGAALRVPQGWTLAKGEQEQFAKAETLGGACSLVFTRVAGVPFITTRFLPAELLKAIQKEQPGSRLVETKRSSIGRKAATDIVYSVVVHGIEIRQTYAYIQQGFWINLLIITVSEPARTSCEPELKAIRDGVVIP